MVKSLPLPEFDTAISRLKYWIQPYVDSDVLTKSLAAVDDFAEHEGPYFYQQLQAYAAESESGGGSWFSELWRSQFLHETESLPLSGSNITMKVDWKAPQHGLKRIAHFAVVMAHVHRDYERGELFTEKKK